MGEVSVRDLKNRLSAHLRRLEEGETITVTRRGKPVAVITPATEAERPEERLHRRLLELQARGTISRVPPIGSKPKGLTPGIKLKGKGPTAAEIVIQGRD